jgi:hypothetical protein
MGFDLATMSTPKLERPGRTRSDGTVELSIRTPKSAHLPDLKPLRLRRGRGSLQTPKRKDVHLMSEEARSSASGISAIPHRFRSSLGDGADELRRGHRRDVPCAFPEDKTVSADQWRSPGAAAPAHGGFGSVLLWRGIGAGGPPSGSGPRPAAGDHAAARWART